MLKILTIIPARAGSKRIPDKNIKLLNGFPLIYYSINAAKQSKYSDRIVVSTDSEIIASIAKKYGAEIPFLRPKELATDTSSSIDVLLHCVKFLKKNEKYKPDLVLLFQPTSPLCNTDDINGLIEKFNKNINIYDSIVSVKKVTEHPEWVYKTNNVYLKKFIKSNKFLKSQDIPVKYIINGALYLVKTRILEKQKNIITEKTGYYEMPWLRSIDIDNENEFSLSEYFISNSIGVVYDIKK